MSAASVLPLEAVAVKIGAAQSARAPRSLGKHTLLSLPSLFIWAQIPHSPQQLPVCLNIYLVFFFHSLNKHLLGVTIHRHSHSRCCGYKGEESILALLQLTLTRGKLGGSREGARKQTSRSTNKGNSFPPPLTPQRLPGAGGSTQAAAGCLWEERLAW